MHRIDADSHVANLFDEGDPGVPREPTQVDADWLNAVQEEVASLIVGRGVALVKGTNTQLATALATVTKIEPTLDANWFMAGYTPRYYKDSAGNVHLEGNLEHNADGQGVAMFTLPTGYRPAYDLVFPAMMDNEEDCYLVVFMTGVVWAKKRTGGAAVSTNGIHLDSVHFHP